MANEVFISYSRKDYQKVRSIKNTIDRDAGINSWMDLNGIEAGDQFDNVIIDAIKRCNTLLFMLSENSMHSDYALKELNFAKTKNKRVVLVKISDCSLTSQFAFHFGLTDIIDWNIGLQREKLLKDLRYWKYSNYSNYDSSSETPPMTISKSSPSYKWAFIIIAAAICIGLAVYFISTDNSSDHQYSSIQTSAQNMSSSNDPAYIINKVWVDANPYRDNGHSFLLMHVNFTIKNCTGKYFCILVHFYHPDGKTQVLDEGDIVDYESSGVQAIYDTSTWSDLKLYKDISNIPSEGYIKVTITDASERGSIYATSGLIKYENMNYSW